MALQTGELWGSRSGREVVKVIYVDRYRSRVSFGVCSPPRQAAITEWLTLQDFARMYPRRAGRSDD